MEIYSNVKRWQKRSFLGAKITNYLIECSRFVLTKVGGRVKVPTSNLLMIGDGFSGNWGKMIRGQVTGRPEGLSGNRFCFGKFEEECK